MAKYLTYLCNFDVHSIDLLIKSDEIKCQIFIYSIYFFLWIVDISSLLLNDWAINLKIRITTDEHKSI